MCKTKSLSESHPELAEEWSCEKNCTLTPEMVSKGSVRKVWWRCKNGHEWQAAVYSRTAGTGCPYCAGISVLPGFNDIAVKNPELLSEWDYERNTDISPEKVAANTNRKVWWKCRYGHSWQAAVYSRTAGKGCPVCAGRKILSGFNDLASQRSDLLLEWDFERNTDVTPSEIPVFTHRKVWWKDRLGHSWKASVANRANGTGCPYCAGRRVLPGFNDLASSAAAFLSEWDYEKNSPLKPEDITRHSQRRVWWKCALGHSWESTADNRYRNGCPVCANRKVFTGFNDLHTLSPELCKEWDDEKNQGISPLDVTGTSRRAVWWKCCHGHSWKAEIYQRYTGQNCPYCHGVLVLPGINDLKTCFPILADQWDYENNNMLLPENVFPFTSQKVWWVCPNGHHWQASVNSRSQGAGCPYCAGFIPYRRRLIP